MQWDVHFGLRANLADEDLLSLIHEAAALSKVVQQIPLRPEVRRKLNRLNIIRAVRGTTGIEGSDLSEDEVEKVLDSPRDARVLPPARLRQELETRNAARVMVYVARALDRDPYEPLTESLICELHRMTTEDIPYDHNEPGKYRNHAVTALDYSPPRTGSEVRRLMSEFIDWLNTPPAVNWHPVVRAIAAHFYLISIHPFGDGNGRTARAIESYLLYQGNVNQLGFYSLANYYYRERSEYIAMLDYTRFQSNNDLTPFLKFSARGLLAELELIKDEVLFENKKVAFRDFYQHLLLQGEGIASRGKTMARLLGLMEILALLGELSEVTVRTGRSPVSGLYPGATGYRTFIRDVTGLTREKLVVRSAGVVRPNYDVMDRFTRPLFDMVVRE